MESGAANRLLLKKAHICRPVIEKKTGSYVKTVKYCAAAIMLLLPPAGEGRGIAIVLENLCPIFLNNKFPNHPKLST